MGLGLKAPPPGPGARRGSVHPAAGAAPVSGRPRDLDIDVRGATLSARAGGAGRGLLLPPACRMSTERPHPVASRRHFDAHAVCRPGLRLSRPHWVEREPPAVPCAPRMPTGSAAREPRRCPAIPQSTADISPWLSADVDARHLSLRRTVCPAPGGLRARLRLGALSTARVQPPPPLSCSIGCLITARAALKPALRG